MINPRIKEQSAVFDINSAADKATFYVSHKMKLLEVGIIPLSTDTGGATISFDITEQGASRGDGDGGVITVPASNSQYDVLSQLASPEVEVGAGAIITVQVNSESAAACSDAVAYIYYELLEDNASNLDNKSNA